MIIYKLLILQEACINFYYTISNVVFCKLGFAINWAKITGLIMSSHCRLTSLAPNCSAFPFSSDWATTPSSTLSLTLILILLGNNFCVCSRTHRKAIFLDQKNQMATVFHHLLHIMISMPK